MRIVDIAKMYLPNDITHLTDVRLLYCTHNCRSILVYLVKQTEPLRQV